MNSLSLHLQLIGASLIFLSIAHLYFSYHLGWKADAARMTAINRQIFYVHAFFICLVLLLTGSLCLFAPETLITRTTLAKWILLGFAIFWGIRLLFQLLVYDSTHWRGHRLNTFAHIAFSLLWSYYTLIFVLAFIRQSTANI